MQTQHLHHVSSPSNGYCAFYAKCKFGSHDPLQTFHNWSCNVDLWNPLDTMTALRRPVVSVQCGIATLESVAWKGVCSGQTGSGDCFTVGTKPWTIEIWNRNLEFLSLSFKVRLTLPVSRRSIGEPFSSKCSSQQLQKERLQLFAFWKCVLCVLLGVLIALLEAKTFKGKATFSCTFLLMPIWWRLLKIVVLSKLLLNSTQGGQCESQVPNSLVPHVQILIFCYSYHYHIMLFLLSSWSLSSLLV